MRGGGARGLPRFGIMRTGSSAVYDDPLRPARIFKRQTARVGMGGEFGRRRAASVDQRQRAVRLQPLIAGLRRLQGRGPARFLMRQHIGEAVAGRCAGAVEQGQRAIAMLHHPQHRQSARNGAFHGFGRLEAAGGENLAQGQKIKQQIERRLGVAADMAAVGEDLPFQLRAQKTPRLRRDGMAGVGADRELHQRDGAERTLCPARCAGAQRYPQQARMLRQRQHEAFVEFGVGFVEQQRRLREKRQKSPRDDGRLLRRIVARQRRR